MLRGQTPQPRPALVAVFDPHGCTLVEQHRVDPLDPRGVVTTRILVALQQGPDLQDVRRRDVARRQPPLQEEITNQVRVGPVSLRVSLPPPSRGRVSGFGQVRGDAGPDQFLHHVAPPGASLDTELDILLPLEPAQPGSQPVPVSVPDLASPHLPVIVST